MGSFPRLVELGDVDDEIAVAVDLPLMLVLQIGGEGLGLDQAGAGNLRTRVQPRKFVDRHCFDTPALLLVDAALGLQVDRADLVGQRVLLPDILARALADALRPDGVLLLSGFTRMQMPALRLVYENLGLIYVRHSGLDEWTLLTFTRAGTARN